MNYLKIKYAFLLLLFVLVFNACQEEEPTLESLVAPTNLTFDINVSQDGSGLVTFSSSAENAIVYHFFAGLGESEKPQVSTNGTASYSYKTSGNFKAKVVAYAAGGIASNLTQDITVEVNYEPDPSIIQTLTNGSTRNWVWKKAAPAHLGVGPEFYDDGAIGDAPIWYTAAAFEKESAGCLYEDVITFSKKADGTVGFVLDNVSGNTYFHVDEVVDALSEPKPGADECYVYDTSGEKVVGFFESETGIVNSTSVGFEITGGGFMSYFLNSSTYEILSITEEELYIRTVQDVDGFRLAWYQKFIAEDVNTGGGGGDYTLVWEDNFDTLDPANWGYDLGAGGWGNGEVQYYTDRADNAYVDNGILKIVAKREGFGGAAFTSARLKSENKYEFTYGKVEVRAKLPTGGGTWPAIWMLGANFDQVGWPACGEIDIMEHVGNNQNTISAALHTPSSFGSTVNNGTTVVSDASTEFHVYGTEWTDTKITFTVDDVPFYTYEPAVRDSNTYPFEHDFFMILNVAMGGSFGGAIDNSFSESTMEIDYVKVYQ